MTKWSRNPELDDDALCWRGQACPESTNNIDCVGKIGNEIADATALVAAITRQPYSPIVRCHTQKYYCVSNR